MKKRRVLYIIYNFEKFQREVRHGEGRTSFTNFLCAQTKKAAFKKARRIGVGTVVVKQAPKRNGGTKQVEWIIKREVK